MHSRFSFVLAALLALGACTKKEVKPLSPEQLVAQGKLIYNIQCIACHNPDPKKDGALGPAVFGSSLELIQHRVVKGDYPAGYTPKRNTRTMAPLPHLAGEIPALYKYLNSEGAP